MLVTCFVYVGVGVVVCGVVVWCVVFVVVPCLICVVLCSC